MNEEAILQPSGYRLVLEKDTGRIRLYDTHGNCEDYRDPTDDNYHDWSHVFE